MPAVRIDRVPNNDRKDEPEVSRLSFRAAKSAELSKPRKILAEIRIGLPQFMAAEVMSKYPYCASRSLR